MYDKNVSLSKLDIFESLPEALKVRYDIIDLREFTAIAKDDTVQTVVDKLKAMLSKLHIHMQLSNHY